MRATDGTDAVIRGAALTYAEAVARRGAGLDIVVSGPDVFSNDRIAYEVEATATPPGRPAPLYHGPHGGLSSLPHWQQRTPPPAGHSFHETNLRRAKATV
jgi:hypothetical protein